MSGYSLVVGSAARQVTGSEHPRWMQPVVAIIITVRVTMIALRTNIVGLSVGSLAASAWSINDN